MIELISKFEAKKIDRFLQKINQMAMRIDIFCSALLLQTWRRLYYIFNKREVYSSLEKRKGNCMRCGRCCHASFRCQHLAYDENGLSLCKIYDRKPHMCSLYPYNESDFFYHIRSTCGYKY
ncbi:MAG: YkgJ family cysteine cluster protein [Candidatus Loosdrechtia sp.]|uniref:YkgJ family cysteine cluster protein n=1 Tax=Candidatus Loosdrechtia sp. TaxID=3101272 RepID=UPI003A61FF4E|nr:MAG: YkgJ family cysteine cluster protein [Candidatus Jettenia sp. AMX2]